MVHKLNNNRYLRRIITYLKRGENMDYKTKVIRKEQLKVDKWSGGTTTQLAIYPEESEYSKRNFKWRISSAKVELEESNFTSLPGIDRIIMIIKGELKLEHEGHYKKTLMPFQQDTFKGDWNTKSYGKVTDFNLMTSKNCYGKIEALIFDSLEKKDIEFNKNNVKYSKITLAVYSVDGIFEININNDENIHIEAGDMALIAVDSIEIPNIIIRNVNSKESKIINSYIYHD